MYSLYALAVPYLRRLHFLTSSSEIKRTPLIVPNSSFYGSQSEGQMGKDGEKHN